MDRRDRERPRRTRLPFLLLLTAGAFPPIPARAAPTELVTGRPTLRAVKVAVAPRLDGQVVDDPAWAAAPPITEFFQTMPIEGAPASERTEVRVVYTADTLYVGVVCHDREPGAIIVSDSRRDSSLADTDSFQIVLDTYLDLQNGFVFGTNPAGVEYDGQVINEGEDSGLLGSSRAIAAGNATQSTTTGGSFNLNWDGSWKVRTSVTDVGWSAEFAIPFRTLRYASGANTWGINFQRNIRRRNETAFWAPMPRGFTLYRVSNAGRLTGLEVPPQHNLKLIPYVRGQADHHAVGARTVLGGDTGADLKYSITPSLTLDATYNTDFAQVEVDEEQVNLNRFNLFFPEKRPFFLENAGLFTVGTPGATEVFFSRRIGISPSGVAIPIVGGARFSGSVAGANVGFLDMQTEAAPELQTPANNFTVARVRRELPNRSSFGALFVNRQATGRLAKPADYNRSFAVDGRMGTGRYGKFVGYAGRTQTPGLGGRQHAFDAGWMYESPSVAVNLEYTEVGEHFNPEVGFVNRVGFRQIALLYFRTIRVSPRRALHEIRPHIRYSGFWNFKGFQETGIFHVGSHFAWKEGSLVDPGFTLNRDGLVRPFEIFPGIVVPPGSYDEPEFQLSGNTNQGAPLSFKWSSNAGRFFGGTRVSMTPSVRFFRGETFSSELSFQRNNVRLPAGSFRTNLIRARLVYAFTPRVLAEGLIQYNDRANVWSMNLRLKWLQQANTGVFLVYNDARGLGDVERPGAGRSLILKVSRMFDVLH